MTDDYVTYKGKKIGFPFKNNFCLAGTDLKDILELEDLFRFKNIGYLELSDNQLTEIKGLEHLPNLVILDLHENKISRISNLDTLKKLRKLELYHNKIEKIEGLNHLTNVEILDLSYNKIKKLENLDNLKELKELKLAFNEVSKIENLDDLINLELLALSGNPNITKIENLDKLTNLKTLVLEGCKIKEISGLSTLKNLETLIHWIYNIDDIITEIEGLEHLINLEYVYINSYNINAFDMDDLDMVVLLRFACMVKSNDFKSIEDWQEVFKKFPLSFDRFQRMNTEFKVEWYIWQCSMNLLTILQDILDDPEYNVIKMDQEEKWNKIFKLAREVFSRETPRKTLREMITEEEMEE